MITNSVSKIDEYYLSINKKLLSTLIVISFILLIGGGIRVLVFKQYNYNYLIFPVGIIGLVILQISVIRTNSKKCVLISYIIIIIGIDFILVISAISQSLSHNNPVYIRYIYFFIGLTILIIISKSDMSLKLSFFILAFQTVLMIVIFLFYNFAIETLNLYYDISFFVIAIGCSLVNIIFKNSIKINCKCRVIDITDFFVIFRPMFYD